MKRVLLLFFVIIASCSQSGEKAPTIEPINVENKVFFDNKPQLTPIPLGEEQPFTSLFAQLEELPNADTNTLQQQLESIADEYVDTQNAYAHTQAIEYVQSAPGLDPDAVIDTDK